MKIKLERYEWRCDKCQYWRRIGDLTTGKCKHTKMLKLFFDFLPFKTDARFSCKLFEHKKIEEATG